MTPRRKKFLYRCFVWGVPTSFILLTLFAEFLPLILGIPALVATGWIFYVLSNIHEATWNWEAILSGLVFLSISVGGFHWVARRIAASRNRIWEWGWSASIAIMFLSLFAISIAVGGITHHSAWLAHSNWINRESSSGCIGWQLAHARQMLIALRLHAEDNGGRYPARLDHLILSGHFGLEGFEASASYTDPVDQRSGPWVYVSGMSSSSPDDLPVIIAPHARRDGSRIIGTIDTSVEIFKAEGIREALPQWKQDYAAVGLPVPPVLLQYEQSPGDSP